MSVIPTKYAPLVFNQQKNIKVGVCALAVNLYVCIHEDCKRSCYFCKKIACRKCTKYSLVVNKPHHACLICVKHKP